ncbi:MAG: type II toxin-antitoxin system Phd/YefM family antitoxin [Coriobacteriales bacterium]|jgi:prevent-host-death family protein|nr:type II toxin-antitoxin system Phd/YefM family antitoxin [Coriobacteriales bacterium]
MRTVNMHDAKTRLSALVSENKPFILAKAGTPVAVVIPYNEYKQSVAQTDQRFGFMPEIEVPEDFDTLMANEIARLFGA